MAIQDFPTTKQDSPRLIRELQEALDDCLIQDRHPIRRGLQRLRRELARGRDVRAQLHRLAERVRESRDKVVRRRAALPRVEYPAALPVSGRVEEIRAALEKHQVVIVAGETGSGKTTQLPKICLAMGRGAAGMIGHTQPRRLAARSVAARIAEELGVAPGTTVGYQVRFADATSELTSVKLMTDGILLAEIQHDPFLNRYDTLIIDEAHERSLNIDFLLGYLKRLLPRRPDLKVIVTSATIDVDKFSRHFDDAPVIEVSGRTWPVDILYRPPSEEGDDGDLGSAVIAAVREIQQIDRAKPLPCKDILVFLSGEREIRDVAEALRRENLPHTEVLPLYARLSNKEQNRVFQAHSGRRIVLATNVAETSLTVPGIGYVIDSGMARISRYSVRSKVQRLPIEAVSKASANQRAGRCGRLCAGTCIRLYSEEDFAARPDFTDTEITRTNLASVILQMLSLGLGDIADFPFVDRPEANAIADGFKLLEELGAVREGRKLSPVGQAMARLPVDPRFARMILEAGNNGSLREVLIIVSALSIQDPRERPLDKQQAADEKHRPFRHEDSDFLAFVNLWEFFEQQRQALGRNQLRKFCQQHFLSFMRMREWRELHRQLHLISRDMKLGENREPASFEAIHQALLSGLLSQIAQRLDDGLYLGARSRKFQLFPGSVLFRRKPRWILSAELVETSQLYARMNAAIDPLWAERLGAHLIKRQYFEPHWTRRRGQVTAYEKVNLYGLALVEKRPVNFGPIDPVVAREIFIREALVAQQLDGAPHFLRHNMDLLRELERIEDKTRRRDILADEETLYRFYDARLPARVFDAASLKRWYGRERRRNPELLLLREEDLLRTDDFDLSQFPDRLDTPAMSLKLDYRFEPGTGEDGVSAEVPVSALRQVQEDDLDWLVPGMLREKCIALVKALPRQVRKHFVPVPDHVDAILDELKQGRGSLRLELARLLKRRTGIEVPLQLWEDYVLDEHLRMNIVVVDAEGRPLGAGRDLAELRERFAGEVRESIDRLSRASLERQGLRSWDFGELPEVYPVRHGELEVQTWPALVDQGDSVALRLLDNPGRAEACSRAGMARLVLLAVPQQVKYLRRQLLQDPRAAPALPELGGRERLLDQLLRKACLLACDLERALPRVAADFEARLARGRGELVDEAQRLERWLYGLIVARQEALTALRRHSRGGDDWLYNDVSHQLEQLLAEDFLFATPWQWLQEFPRYFKAISARLDKFPRQAERDREWTRALAALWQRYADRKAYCERQEIHEPDLEHFRWMLEEYRVSLYAQHLGTRFPVSEQRLEKLWSKTA